MLTMMKYIWWYEYRWYLIEKNDRISENILFTYYIHRTLISGHFYWKNLKKKKQNFTILSFDVYIFLSGRFPHSSLLPFFSSFFLLLFRFVIVCAISELNSFALPVGLAGGPVRWYVCGSCTTLFLEQSLTSEMLIPPGVYLLVCVCMRVNWDDERMRYDKQIHLHFGSIVSKDNQSSFFILTLSAYCGRT